MCAADTSGSEGCDTQWQFGKAVDSGCWYWVVIHTLVNLRTHYKFSFPAACLVF